jgi:hypothetical protein
MKYQRDTCTFHSRGLARLVLGRDLVRSYIRVHTWFPGRAHDVMLEGDQTSK